MRWKTLDYKSSKHYVPEREAQEEQPESSDEEVSDAEVNLLLSQQEDQSSHSKNS